MAQKIDDAEYNVGRAAFASGATLRGIVERFDAADRLERDDLAAGRAEFDRSMSCALGFADATLAAIRSLRKP